MSEIRMFSIHTTRPGSVSDSCTISRLNCCYNVEGSKVIGSLWSDLAATPLTPYPDVPLHIKARQMASVSMEQSTLYPPVTHIVFKASCFTLWYGYQSTTMVVKAKLCSHLSKYFQRFIRRDCHLMPIRAYNLFQY